MVEIEYADNTGALGTLARLEIYFDSLKRHGSGRGYHLEPSKSILIVHQENIKAVKVFSKRHGFRVRTGTNYFGGYIGNNKFKSNWLRESTLTWERNIKSISETAGKHPQESYAAVVCAIQSEWISIQRATWDTGDSFAGVEKMLHETFLPRIFFGKTKTLSTVVGALSVHES